MVVTLVVMVVAAGLAAGVGVMANRRRPGAPTAVRGEPPTRLDRRDFRSPDSPWLIAVFTSATCSSCAAVLAELRGYATASVVVTEVEVGADPALHRRYGIESVPTAVIADATGDAKLAFVGPLGPDHRAALATVLASPTID